MFVFVSEVDLEDPEKARQPDAAESGYALRRRVFYYGVDVLKVERALRVVV